MNNKSDLKVECGSEYMIISLKKVDDRPRILWRCSLVEPGMDTGCKMRNTPIEFFICPQITICRLICMQKIEQRQRPDYVHEQRLKMLIKIEHLANYKMNNGDNGNNSRKK